MDFVPNKAGWSLALSLLATLFAPTALAARFFTQAVLPEGASTACGNALMAEVACSHAVPALQAGNFYPKAELEKICTSGCASSLASYHAGVVSACSEDTWVGFQDVEEPVALISEMIRYHYNFTCLTDGTRFCNNVAAAISVFLDPETAALPGGIPAGGDYGDEVSDPCDQCLVQILRFQAGSPYYMGLDLQQSSAYESKTSSCGIANAPLTKTTLSLFSPTEYVPATPTCAGKTYEIKAGDDCHSISVSQGIGTDWLLTDNDLSAACVDFPSSGKLCLVNTCDVYTVAEGDTCKSITREFGMTDSQFRAWNPSVDAGCYNLQRMVGDQVCVAVPGTPYITPAPTTIAPSIPTTAAPVPTNIAQGTNTYCGRYYEAIPGDYCNLVIMKFAISLSDFLFLNPAVNENCTNLFAYESYCIQPVGDINTYSGKPGHITFSFTATRNGTFEDVATGLPNIGWSSPTPTTTPVPLASGTRDDCENYILGDLYQQNLENSYLISNCHLAAEVMGVTLEDLETWNTDLGNASDPSCAFEAGLRYCGKYYEGDQPDAADPVSQLPVRDGMTPNCTEIVEVASTDGMTCTEILSVYGITIEQFFAWNPSVGADCLGMWAGYQYCVATSDEQPTPTRTSTSSSTVKPTGPPGPTQTGQPANCNKWHIAVDGDDCGVLEREYSITHAQFLSWNPAVSEDCVNGFWGDYAYCVGVSGGASSTSSTITTPPTTTPTKVPIPDPHQDGIVENCNKFAQAQDGDWCALFAERHSISPDDLYLWNTVLGSGGANCNTMFWKDTWYCIGVA
ncbi:LysM domain-containing protein [Durotheca rogersii]|uniref:LysM domain-containing protein n=1 Tax=Durotheca rogersii TaxID=419775 RepID=UPI002220AE31|nr:LysM domain-containing protein [Durotheca rogersii]KAI5866007.1 LysM domain-containing protein [Durotheca rogersii]